MVVDNPLKWAHQIAGKCDPCDSFLVKIVGEGATCKRMLSRPTIKKQPIAPEIILKLVQSFGQNSNSYDKRTIAICLLAYSGFLRSSELVNLKCCDVVFHDLYVSLFIEKSKTDQHRDGNWVVIAKTGSLCCPVNCLQEYMDMANLSLQDKNYLFRQVNFLQKVRNFYIQQIQSAIIRKGT